MKLQNARNVRIKDSGFRYRVYFKYKNVLQVLEDLGFSKHHQEPKKCVNKHSILYKLKVIVYPKKT